MLPTLPIPVKNFEPMEAYIAEIEGLSGSPIWMRPTALNAAQKDEGGEKLSVPFNGDTDMFFLGLLHGWWEIPKEAMQGQSAQYTENMISGMSIIVPAHKILEVINQPELAAMRKKNDENEADRMLDMGFLPAIRQILSTLPKRRQTLCFSLRWSIRCRPRK